MIYNNDIIDYINSFLYIENIILLLQSSKYLNNTININEIIYKKYNYEYKYFKIIYIDILRYNIILDNLLKANKNTLLLIKQKYFIDNTYKKNLLKLYIIFINLIYNINYPSYFEIIKYKIYIINNIISIINHIYKNDIIFCSLYVEIINTNSQTQYIYNIDNINNNYIEFNKLYNILQYNTILYNNLYN